MSKAVVGSPDGEHHLFLVPGLAVITGIIVCPDLLGHAEGRPGLGPAGVKGRVGQNLRDLLPGDAVLPGGSQVVLEGAVHQPLGHQRHHRDQRPVPQGELILPAPDLTKEHIVIELGKFGGKFPQGISARRLFHCHTENASYSSEKVTETAPSPSTSCNPEGSSILASLVKLQELVP